MSEKVSIVVPIYNSEKYLKKCIDSIINQTYANIEIILINDGSTDNSAYICEYYSKKDSRVQVIHTNNMEVSNARNTGIKHANGQFIQFVDSDDYIDANMTETLLKKMNSQDVDITICGLKRRYKNKLLLLKFHKSGSFTTEQFVIENLAVISDLIIGSPCNKLYKTNIIKKNNIIFDTSIDYAEDLIFNYRYLKKTFKVAVLPDCLYNYNTNSESLATRFREDCFDNFNYVCRQTRKFLEEYSISKENTNIINNKFANIYIALINHLYRSDSTLSKIETRKIIEKEFYFDKEKADMIDKAKFDKLYFNIIWFLVKRKYYFLLEFFYQLKNTLRNCDLIYNLYSNYIYKQRPKLQYYN